MIKGIGVDLVDKSRINDIYFKHGLRFENKILSLKELEELSARNDSNKISYLSNNFACKEACSKVLGKGFSNGIKFKDIEVLRNSDGGPFINLYGEASVLAKNLEINNIHVSITDSKESSIAFVIGESL
ncbi:MAG: holo-[acyl-carrier-protein] synthase [Gammaproteobacteria bacterium]|jgi:holo-[acyl-carrier-protein] synthase|nr:MAG: holo-[acyl-carrier-protein] synthase [Gammaproteobacteria bacterium]